MDQIIHYHTKGTISTMKLYDLGHVPWLESQLIYHALPRLDMEGLILLSPTCVSATIRT